MDISPNRHNFVEYVTSPESGGMDTGPQNNQGRKLLNMKEITEKTLLPVSMVVLLLYLTNWITTLQNQSQYLLTQMAEVRVEQKEQARKYSNIMEEIARVQGRLGIARREEPDK